MSPVPGAGKPCGYCPGSVYVHSFPCFSSRSIFCCTSLHSLRDTLFFHVLLIVLPQATSKRIRRDTHSNSSLNTCALHIAADYSFFKHVGSGSESATVAEMVYHVAMTDKAFRATDFNQDGGPGDGIGFVIAAVTVFKDETSEGSEIFAAT